MFWEYMQEPSGAIHWGTETQRYSPFTTYDKETKRFGTEVLDTRSAGFASGMFMHLARIMKPYKPDRAEDCKSTRTWPSRPPATDSPHAQALLRRPEVPAHRRRVRPSDGQGPGRQRQCVCRNLQRPAGIVRRRRSDVVETAGWPLSSSRTSSRRPGPPIRPWSKIQGGTQSGGGQRDRISRSQRLSGRHADEPALVGKQRGPGTVRLSLSACIGP